MSDILHSLNVTPAEFWVQVVGFIVLIWLLNRYLSRPILNVIESRQTEIRTTYDQLDADREAMTKARAEYEQRLAGIESDARERIQAAVKEAQELRGSIIADAQKQAESIVETGRADLERERTRTFLELRQDVVNLAIQAAERVVGESMNDERQRRLVDQFIAGVGSANTSSAAVAQRNGSVINGNNGASPAGAA